MTDDGSQEEDRRRGRDISKDGDIREKLGKQGINGLDWPGLDG
jgi:hypothetical protein